MGWIADHEVPALRRRDIPQIIRPVNGNAVCQAVLGDCATTRLDRFRVDVGKAQDFGKSVSQQRKADEAGPGAPFEYAALPRHPPQLEERNEILAKAITATIEVLLEIYPRVAVAGVRPTIELIERRL